MTTLEEITESVKNIRRNNLLTLEERIIIEHASIGASGETDNLISIIDRLLASYVDE